ncbi:MAG: DNA mismatch repair protein MutS [Clostridia bacterium]|nr:DNA mismatch repair protein MutS [Clostridia bacterium]
MNQKLSPMMQHYLSVKQQYPDCFLFYRLGDFYEMFFDDAVEGSKILELTLTGRDCGLDERAPMCGVPYHAVDTYINKMIHAGHKVAICEQMEDPALAKGLVERSVIRVITPGTVIEENILDANKNNYLVAVNSTKTGIGYAYCDISVGSFVACELYGGHAETDLFDELNRLNPTEILANESLFENTLLAKQIQSAFYLERMPDVRFLAGQSAERLKKHFQVASLVGFGLEGKNLAIGACGALLQYLEETQKNSLSHLHGIRFLSRAGYMQLDVATRRNLELTMPLRFDGNPKETLLYLLDATKTKMGSRMLRTWIDCPLQQKEAIDRRLDAVSAFFSDMRTRRSLRSFLDEIYDIERLTSKIAYGSINGRDCVALANSLRQIVPICMLLGGIPAEAIDEICRNLDPMEDVVSLIDSAIAPNPPVNIKDGGLIRPGYNAEVDELRSISSDSKRWLEELVARERESTGIKTLRIGFNRVFGYYLEVTKSLTHLVPHYFERRQTLANAERYITPELKELEQKILGASERLLTLETELFTEIRTALLATTERLQSDARMLAELDVYQSLAEVAVSNRYVRPIVATEPILHIVNGRHPIVERTLKDGFIPNDVHLDVEDNRLLIVTGPNMAGKSTYMRQVALITLMMHIGSYVPADSAEIGIVDRIFTRIGASDSLASGQSTFMVEMSEMANIVNNATKNSLLILDEIGRGTSTFDGLSIAWSVLEYIANPVLCGAKTLFATHYHELSELEGKLQGVVNYRITVKEIGDDILFLRKIVRGSADKSFGIQVAKLAGLPDEVVSRAKEILAEIEHSDPLLHRSTEAVPQTTSSVRPVDSAILKDLNTLDLNHMTPVDAFLKLHEYLDALRG